MICLFKRFANMFHVSRKTISRWIDSHNLREEIPKYDDISDEALDSVVSAVLHDFPNCGIGRMKGFLLGWGVRVQWSRVRSSLWRTDPASDYPTEYCKSVSLQCSRAKVPMALRWESQIDQVGLCYTQFSLMSVEACYLVFSTCWFYLSWQFFSDIHVEICTCFQVNWTLLSMMILYVAIAGN